MNSDYETISFSTERKIKIGKVTYIVNSFFDENGDTLIDKIKRLLVTEVQNYFSPDV